jgi:hypothetical protein
VLRPDWVAIIYGSKLEPDDAAFALDGEVIGYAYCNGGLAGAGRNDVRILLPDEVAHWSPIPDPEGAGIGMSWISAAMRDMQGDRAATEHKLKFFTNGATPNLVVKGIPAPDREKFDMFVDMLEARHAGLGNAYRTLYLTAGVDATVVGSDLKQLDFKATQGAGESRIAMLGRVPAPLLGISEGLAGSSLNAGNFGMARRIFADSWIFPTLQDLCSALAPMVNVPRGAELWFDTTDMPILREDAKDAAEIEQVKATTINSYITAGFTPESSVAATRGQDVSLLVHSGLVSVQLQPPGMMANDAAPPAGGAGPKAQAVMAARSLHPDGDFTDEEAVDALIEALAYFDEDAVERSWDPAKHPRNPSGSPGGGRFRSLVDRIIDAITEHHKSGGKGDPLEGFDRPQLLKVAKARGIKLDRGEPRESIVAKLIADVGSNKSAHSKPKAIPDKPKVPPGTPKVTSKAPAKSSAIPDLSLPDDISPADASRYVDLHVQLAAVPWQRKPGTKHELHRPGAAAIEHEMGLLLQGKSLRTKGMLRREGDTEIKFREWAQANHPDMPLDDVRELVRTGLADAFADRPIAVRTTPAGLSGVLKAGRFKTQFETGRASKGATYYPEKRAQVENELFGYAWDLKKSDRPVYGYVGLRDPRHAGYWSQPGRYDDRHTEDLLSAYGDVQVVLKPQVRERTTAAIGDTIDSSVLPSPVDAPTWQSAMVRTGYTTDYKSDEFAQRSYAEAQIHGGVKVDDIAEVFFANHPSDALRDLLKRLGIPWRTL